MIRRDRPLGTGPLADMDESTGGSSWGGGTGGQKAEGVGGIEQQSRLLQAYLRGLTDHRKNLDEYLVQLQREREDLERERGDLNRRIEANEEERGRVTRYIEEIPRLRDRTLRSLIRTLEDLGDE